jgi:hypothetical protein
VPPGADTGSTKAHPAGKDETQFAGGIVRFGLSSSEAADIDFAGGIVRFSLGHGANGTKQAAA